LHIIYVIEAMTNAHPFVVKEQAPLSIPSSSKTPFLSNRSQFIVQENRNVMFHDARFYLMGDKVAVLSVKDLAET
jgi:hypothetical protein